MTLNEIPLWFSRASVISFGLLWGSFLNVVIHRVPRELSVVRPGSRCPECEKPIAAYDNVPVLSYLVLRGRARCCGAKISPRYPLVEALAGALSLAIFELVVRTLPADTSLLHASAVYLVDLTLCLGLLAAAFIDAEYMYLPDAVTLGGTALALVSAPLHGLPYLSSGIGAVAGFLLAWLPFTVIYKLVRGRSGMGLGDAKLLALAGAWFGAPTTLFVLFAGAIQASVWAGIVYLVRGKIEEPEAVRQDREELMRAADEGDEEAKKLLDEDPLGKEPEGIGQSPIAFGPFLILGILEYLFLGDILLAWISPEY
ncbi:prepilin peptidase [Pendulispora rubella]|uniref:Prepilin leader peptidase/N-methyltransferase n=1 Tax=Pendulispora rubella TaxID=2741070 RepID=A0ABZ2L592_9BACT